MPVTKVTSGWVGGDLYFYDVNGDEIFHVDGTNRALVIHASAGLTAPLEVDATDIAAGAVTYGKITLPAGNALVGTKTTGIASLCDQSAAGAIVVGQGAGETPLAKTLSSDVTMASSGAVTIAAKAVTAGKMAAAAGTILVGTKTSGDVTALDASAAGAVAIGQGAGETMAAHTLTGDVTMSSGGVTAIGATKVTNAMLANGAGVGAIVTAGLGNSASYIKTKNDTTDLLAAGAKAQAVIGLVVVDEIFADAGGNQPTFSVGEEGGTVDKFFLASALTNKAAGTVLAFAGTQTIAKKVQVTGVKAVGAGTGGISVTILAIPTS
jgi:hypothetical protein